MREPSSRQLTLALGSNLGNRVENLCFGVLALAELGIRVEVLSPVFETPPLGYLHQPPFLNMVASASTDLPHRSVLTIFRSVEERAGRTREFVNAPRTLDLDLLFFKGLILRETGLQVPHPRWKERSFVVRPLAAISPYLRDPETGWQVHEVARYWPMEPEEIRMVLSPEAFRKALEEWKL